ncbi:adenylosuccinate lyase [Buchnera aphidicola]|uniref:adenylosuccinate lyase n=1 Tax=Buchnera aphidicola TaxID=9 RepID=UPI003464E555
MNDFSLLAISPIDGRYYKNTRRLKKIFSEYAFFKFRVKIEIKWLQKLSSISEVLELPALTTKNVQILNNIIDNFNFNDAKEIKNIEKITNHDIKSIEYFLKKKISEKIIDYKNIINFIHFSCTSEDINNLAYAYMMKISKIDILLPYWSKILITLKSMAKDFKNISMLSRTHGQPATPSTLGKEIINFYYRLYRQFKQLKKINILGKFNGATGNYNAHIIAYPLINWKKVSEEFVTSLGFHWNPYTTQIEPHDYISEIFSCICRFNTILINLNQDFWGYISLNYFIQKNRKNEVGSSTMPHKINPIDFEKSEGNLGLSNAIMNHMISKLPISRWQRDLSDSTVLRNIGIAIGYSMISYDAILSGLQNIQVNNIKIKEDLYNQWQLLSEPIQTVMRRFGISDSYEQLKKLTRGNNINFQDIHKYIDNLTIPKKEKKILKQITPMNYIGDAINIVQNICN